MSHHVAEVSALPLVFREGRVLVPAYIEGVGERWFILDTAAGGSVISSRIREALQPHSRDVRRETIIGATGPTELEIVRIPGLRIGSNSHSSLWSLIADLPEFRDFGGLPVEGILGVDVLATYDVVIDIPAGSVALHPMNGTASDSFGEGGASIPFRSELQDGLVQFSIQLNQEPVEAILDTGAQYGMINWPAANLAGIVRSDADSTAGRHAGGMSGDILAVERHSVDDLCVDDLCWPSTSMNVVDLPIFHLAGFANRPAMLFGVELLANCRILVAYSSNTLHFCTDPAGP